MLAICVVFSVPVQAQATSVPSDLEPRQAIGTILMAGLVGGILGLSTLSFYEKPQDNIRNISIGAGVGIIASALYLTYSVADQGTPRMGRVSVPPEAERGGVLFPNFDGESAGLAYALEF
jgi:hypothetical protein